MYKCGSCTAIANTNKASHPVSATQEHIAIQLLPYNWLTVQATS